MHDSTYIPHALLPPVRPPSLDRKKKSMPSHGGRKTSDIVSVTCKRNDVNCLHRSTVPER